MRGNGSTQESCEEAFFICCELQGRVHIGENGYCFIKDYFIKVIIFGIELSQAFTCYISTLEMGNTQILHPIDNVVYIHIKDNLLKFILANSFLISQRLCEKKCCWMAQITDIAADEKLMFLRTTLDVSLAPRINLSCRKKEKNTEG